MKKLALLVLVAACIDKGDAAPTPNPVDRSYVQENLEDEVPPMDHRVDARLRLPDGGEVMYIGNDVESTTAAPGDEIVVVHHWRVITPPGPGWEVLSSVSGDGADYLDVSRSDLRTGHPVGTWKTGEILRDEQTIVLPRLWKSRRATLRVGLHPVGSHRARDRVEIDVATLTVDVSKAPPPPGTLALKKANGAIVIDGKADDAGWRNAAVQTAFTVAEGCPEMPDATEAKLSWDDQFLYVFVSAEDADVFSPFTNRDDHLWENDVIEVFVDADGNKRGYVELQVNPRNVVFDTWFAVGRPNRDDSFDAQMQTAVVVRGTIDDRTDGDAGWDVEIAIPLASVKGKDDKMKVNIPPKIGDVWRLNVVRGEAPASGRKTASSWNRITCEDFHGLDRMLNVQFADEKGATKP